MPLEQCVLGRLDWTDLDHLARRLDLENRRLFREGIDALPSLRRRLLDYDELREAENENVAADFSALRLTTSQGADRSC
jgi:hypothetical protein